MKLSNRWTRKHPEWVREQRLPLYIHEDADVHVRGRWLYTRDAFLPWITKGWGHDLQNRLRRVGWHKLGQWASRLDEWVYFKGGDMDRAQLRTMPLVWRLRALPPTEAFGQPIYGKLQTSLLQVPAGEDPPKGPAWHCLGPTDSEDGPTEQWAGPVMQLWAAPPGTPLPSLEGWVPMGWIPDDKLGDDDDE